MQWLRPGWGEPLRNPGRRVLSGLWKCWPSRWLTLRMLPQSLHLMSFTCLTPALALAVTLTLLTGQESFSSICVTVVEAIHMEHRRNGKLSQLKELQAAHMPLPPVPALTAGITNQLQHPFPWSLDTVSKVFSAQNSNHLPAMDRSWLSKSIPSASWLG